MKGRVLFTKKKQYGFYGFIKTADQKTYYFDTKSMDDGGWIKQGDWVRFDLMDISHNRVKAIQVRKCASPQQNAKYFLDPEKARELREAFAQKLENTEMLSSDEILPVLREMNVELPEDGEGLVHFIRNNFSELGRVFPHYRVGKTEYPFVLIPSWETLSDEDRERIRQAIDEKMETEDEKFLLCAILPAFLNSLEIDFKLYAPNIASFVNQYLADSYKCLRNVKINGKNQPAILVPLDSDLEESDYPEHPNHPKQKEKKNTAPKPSNELIGKLDQYLQNQQYGELLRSPEFQTANPVQLGADGIQLVIRAIAGYLGNPTNIVLNEFQRKLIEATTSLDLFPLREDESILEQGLRSSFAPADMYSFRLSMGNLFYGKNTKNDNWMGIAERFWYIKNDLAFYINAILIIVSGHEKGFPLYLDEFSQIKTGNRLADMLRILRDFSDDPSEFVTLQEKRKIMGLCLDNNLISELCDAIELFDTKTMPESKSLLPYLCGEQAIDCATMMQFCHSQIEARVNEKLVNFFWYREQKENRLSPCMIQILSEICWVYDESYPELILYNETYQEFKLWDKINILLDAFEELCERSKSKRKTYLLVNYVYSNFIEKDPAKWNPSGKDYAGLWSELKQWMVDNAQKMLSEDLCSTQILALFRYDKPEMNELEVQYCKRYIKPRLDSCTDEESLEELIEAYKNKDIPFLTQWIQNQYGTDDATEADLLIQQQRFSEAISCVQNCLFMNVMQKKEKILKILCENFKSKGLDEAGWEVFVHGISPAAAEEILLEKMVITNDNVCAALFGLYLYEKDWLKIAYLFIPYQAIRNHMRPEFCKQIRNRLQENHLLLQKSWGHLDVLRLAIKTLSNEEFDRFFDWAAKIRIPTKSKLYRLNVKIFDFQLKNMLSGGFNYDHGWNQMASMALRTDNRDRQDMIRYSIIISFIGRYGMEEFEKIIEDLSRKNHKEKDYPEFYSSIWKGLLGGSYSINLFDLNLPLIREAPITYWRLFYQVAVCDNHIFTTENMTGANWVVDKHYPFREFYQALVSRYSECRDPVFLKIAVSLLLQCGETVIPEFDKYFPYCNSNKPKEFLYQAILTLIRENRYTAELRSFLNAPFWNRTEQEQKLHLVLQRILDRDASTFNAQFGTDWDRHTFECCSEIFLLLFSDYPQVHILRVLKETELPRDVLFQLIKIVIQISFTTKDFYGLIDVGLVVPPKCTEENEGVMRSYMDLMNTMYRKELQGTLISSSVWVQNRYIRILTSEIFLHGASPRYDDEDIVVLMQKNRNYSDVYVPYKNFREALQTLLEGDSMTLNQKQLLLIAIVSNIWEEFLDRIGEFPEANLKKLHDVLLLTNYREMHMQLLKRFLVDREGVYSEAETEKASEYSPRIGYILREIKRIREEEPESFPEVRNRMVAICRLKQQESSSVSYRALNHILDKHPEFAAVHWDLIMACLWSTNYESTMVFMFGKDVRKIKNLSESHRIHQWESVFRSMSKTSVYDYLLAVWYAIGRKREEAKKAYARIIDTSEIPAQWSAERKELENYLEGRSKFFAAQKDEDILPLMVEKEAGILNFVTDAAANGAVSCQDAADAFMTLQGSPSPAVQRNACKKMFGFIQNPEDLYEVYRQLEAKTKKLSRKTYNELVIQFGSLLIVADDTVSHDEKFEILSSMMDVFGLLADINKEKESVVEELKAAEIKVLSTVGMSLDIWLNRFPRICEIISHPVIGNPPQLLEELRVLVESCISKVSTCETRMQFLKCLEMWRGNWNLSSSCSDYEQAFIKAVDDALYSLRHGINLQLSILNEDSLIEDGSVFYQIENVPEKSSSSVILNNQKKAGCAWLEVKIGLNDEELEVYDNTVFSNEVELRPGDICGEAYRLHSSILSRMKEGDQIRVILTVYIGQDPICNNDWENRLLYIKNAASKLTPDLVSVSHQYETAVPAFTKLIKGYGRNREKELIREYLEQHLVVIYGPSRAGKSSLMNYVSNEWLPEYCSMEEHSETAVAKIMIAGVGYTNDYLMHILHPGQSIADYTNTQMMEYIFLTPLQMAFDGEKQNDRCEFYGAEFPAAAREGICSVLSRSGKILSKYKEISRILEQYHCEVWLMFDEFQMTLGRLRSSETELANLCTNIKYMLSGIKLILCGSDDLLRVFECNDDPKWNEFTIKTAGNSVAVGQLEREDFISMMEDEKIWKKIDRCTPYSHAALNLLHRYTGGNAICGKIFGCEIFNRIHNGKYANRTRIYSSDITQIAYSLLHSAASLIKTQLIANNTKNMETEKKYLYFIANELSNDTNHADVSLRKIREFFVTRSSFEIDMALKILVARGILQTGSDKKRYGFTTMFYYDFFRSEVTEQLMQELSDAEQQSDEKEHGYWVTQVIDIMKEQDQVTEGDLVDIINSLNEPKLQEGIGKRYGKGDVTNIHKGDIVGGDKIGEQKILINAHTINLAFQTLLTGDVSASGLANALSGMPSIHAYLDQGRQQKLLELQEELSNSENPEDICDVELQIEEMTQPAVQQMLCDSVGAVLANDEFMDVPDERWMELLNLRSMDALNRLRSIPTEFVTSLGFAVMLHNIFDQIDHRMDKDSRKMLDYCPVSIMYCKVLEAMLKKLHTPIYIDRVGNETIRAGGIRFEELLDADGVTVKTSKDLTIGSFAHCIVSGKRENDVDDPVNFKVLPRYRTIHRLSQISDDSAEKNQTWSRHASDLQVVLAIRNKSAHDAAPITRENFDWLIRVLFGDNELVRIAELAKNS